MSTTLSPDADHELQQVERANATTEEFGTSEGLTVVGPNTQG